MSTRSVVPGIAAQRAALALRLGVALQCATLAWLALRHGTSLHSLFFMQLRASEPAAVWADRTLAALAAVSGVLLLARPARAAAVAAGLAFLVLAVTTSVVGGRAFAGWAPLAHATRWLAPLALALLAGGRRQRAASWVLRVAVAATFLAHGWQALGFHPAFVDLLIGSARRWGGVAPAESTVHVALIVIGAIDLLVALLLLVARPPLLSRVAAWAAVWGLGTAAARTVVLGPEFLHESLMRVMNGAAPLALWLLWRGGDPEA